MNGAHLHLMVNHVPVVLAPLAAAVLALGLVRRNTERMKVGLGVLVAAALVTFPTFLTGEPAAEIVGALPEIDADTIEHHEEAAVGALVAITITGAAACASLLLGARRRQTPRWVLATTLLLGLIASGWLGLAANLGGSIRHSEIRPAATTAP